MLIQTFLFSMYPLSKQSDILTDFFYTNYSERYSMYVTHMHFSTETEIMNFSPTAFPVYIHGMM